MVRNLLAIVAVCMIGAAVVAADTVHFHDGTTLDGKVVRVNENSIRLEFGNGSMLIPVSQIAHIEENDRVADFNLNQVHPLAEQRREELRERTGLTAEQRALVRDVMAPLNSEDPMAVAAARDRLVALNKDMDVFQFLETSLPFLTDRYVPEVMHTLAEMDPERAGPVLQSRTQDVAPRNRGVALELLAATGSSDSVETLVRGLVDYEPEVRVSAARALAVAREMRSTPALLEGLQSPDAHVRQACRAALRTIWSTESGTVDFETHNEWSGFWASRASLVEQPIDPNDLTPLIIPPPWEISTQHDE